MAKKSSRGKRLLLSDAFNDESGKLARQVLAAGAISVETLTNKLSNPAVRKRLAKALNVNPVQGRQTSDQDFLSAYKYLLTKRTPEID